MISNRSNVHRDSRGRPKCSLLVHSRDVISLMKPAFVWLGFREPDCNVIAEKGGGPDARPSWAGSGPRAGGCPTLHYTMNPELTWFVMSYSYGEAALTHILLASHKWDALKKKQPNVIIDIYFKFVDQCIPK